jgi:preprotein translocase subunit YajC
MVLLTSPVYAQAPAATKVEGEELTPAINKAPAAPAGQPTGPDATTPAGEPKQQQPLAGDEKGKQGPFGGGNNYLIFVMLGFLVLMMVWSSRSRKKKEAKHLEMLSSLKKGDKVTSIGGIIGTIIETRDDEVLVKVDETNNVRMRFARWAIKGTGESAKTQPPEEKK